RVQPVGDRPAGDVAAAAAVETVRDRAVTGGPRRAPRLRAHLVHAPDRRPKLRLRLRAVVVLADVGRRDLLVRLIYGEGITPVCVKTGPRPGAPSARRTAIIIGRVQGFHEGGRDGGDVDPAPAGAAARRRSELR